MDCNVLAEMEPSARPAGLVEPREPSLLRALRAADSHRRVDHRITEPSVDTSSTDESEPDQAWRLMLRGLILAESHRLIDAESHFLQAAARAMLAWTTAPLPADDGYAARLAARSFHHLGCVYRRQDRPTMAESAHQTALQLRHRFGSFDELWESADELGLDLAIARRFDDAARWYERALGFAERAGAAPLAKQALSWSHLASVLDEAGRLEEAVSAGRQALDLRRRHLPGDIDVAKAEHYLGSLLLRSGGKLAETGDARVAATIDESVERLTNAGNELSAFGLAHDEEAQTIRDELDFATRLQAVLRR